MKKADNKNKKAEEVVSGRAEIYDWIQCIVYALIACVIVFVFFVRLVDVVGSSMHPTLEEGDKMVVTNLFYKPKQGDIIVFQKDDYADYALVKRVIATEMQTVEIDFDKHIVYVDGKALDEPYIAEPTANKIDFTGVQIVPPGCVFVMGDNRNDSTDSRDERIGMVDTRNIIGKVMFISFPFDHIGSPYTELPWQI